MSDLIDRQAAIEAIMGQPPEPHYPSWYAAQIEKLPAVQPDHVADVSKKVDVMHEYIYKIVKDCDGVNCYIKQGKIIRCKDCKHKHVENMVWTCPFGLPGGENFFCGYGIGGNDMDDLISRQAAISAICNACGKIDCDKMDKCEKLQLPPANCSEIPNDSDTISRQAAIDALARMMPRSYTPDGSHPADEEIFRAQEVFADCIEALEILPSAQPGQHTCVNCGRTVNNGGWYADGRTRCPIEEHYALPKDGYCHLWEKRNVTDDDYPERRTDE